MKYLIIFLISFNCFAEFRAKFIPNDSKLAGYTIEKDTMEELNDRILSIVKKAKWLQGTWNEASEGAIVSETILNDDAEMITRYYHPENFTVQIENITQEMSNKKAKNLTKQQLRDKLNSGVDLKIDEINTLLRE